MKNFKLKNSIWFSRMNVPVVSHIYDSVYHKIGSHSRLRMLSKLSILGTMYIDWNLTKRNTQKYL